MGIRDVRRVQSSSEAAKNVSMPRSSGELSVGTVPSQRFPRRVSFSTDSRVPCLVVLLWSIEIQGKWL